jgi:uncharacterized protein YyaL (SSP411 family)
MSLEPEDPHDENGIPLFRVRHQNYYHPVYLFETSLSLISNYLTTQNTAYLERAVLYSMKMVELADDKHDGTLFFPYRFDNRLKAKIRGETVLVKAPWYSGMAQGQALSVFCRLYTLTRKEEYLSIARKVFRSFLVLERENGPWFVHIDSNSNLWIEECPVPVKATILNGFIYGIYGLYEYCQVTNDETAKILFQAAVTTIETHIHRYRNKGNLSWYSLDNFHITTPEYHQCHIDQLEMLYKMTGNFYFHVMSRRFYEDYH